MMNQNRVSVEQGSQNGRIPTNVMAAFRTYRSWQLHWYFIHYAAGLSAIVGGGLATAAGAGVHQQFIVDNTWVWGLVATVLSSVVTFLGPLQKAESYKHAYYILRSAMTRYENRNIDLTVLLNEYDRAQSIVLVGDPTAKPGG